MDQSLLRLELSIDERSSFVVARPVEGARLGRPGYHGGDKFYFLESLKKIRRPFPPLSERGERALCPRTTHAQSDHHGPISRSADGRA